LVLYLLRVTSAYKKKFMSSLIIAATMAAYFLLRAILDLILFCLLSSRGDYNFHSCQFIASQRLPLHDVACDRLRDGGRVFSPT
jgi:hypothetical protein